MDNIHTSKKRKRVPPKRFYDEVFPSYKRSFNKKPVISNRVDCKNTIYETIPDPIYETIPDPIYNPLIFLPAIIFIFIYFTLFIPLHILVLVTMPAMTLFINNSWTRNDDDGIEFVENITADDRQRMAEEKGEVINVD